MCSNLGILFLEMELSIKQEFGENSQITWWFGFFQQLTLLNKILRLLNFDSSFYEKQMLLEKGSNELSQMLQNWSNWSRIHLNLLDCNRVWKFDIFVFHGVGNVLSIEVQ